MATIQVVDDKPLNPSLLTTLLGSGGHHLVEASNGFEAIDKALTEPPDFDDHRHPQPEMDGYQPGTRTSSN
jgi:CheY-like chemotaxis protein